MYTVYEVEGGTKYLFQAHSPINAMEKIMFTLNITNHDFNARITETKHGYVLMHKSKEYWVKK